MMSKPQESLHNCHSLFQVLKEDHEGYERVPVARLYYDAFQISTVHGDQARASIFADRGYKARAICEGERSPETGRMKSLALKSGSHSSFGAYSTKWKSSRERVPKRLDTEQFEKWLFKLDK